VPIGNDLDNPVLRDDGLNFHHRVNQPRDERSLYGQGCFVAAMLIIPTAPRDFWIRRLERLHIEQAAPRETVPRRPTSVPVVAREAIRLS
jgi:hypothetical protein